MTSLSQEILKAKDARNNSLLAVRNVYNSEKEQIERRDSLKPILFGQGEVSGILTIYEKLYNILVDSLGKTTLYPNFLGGWEAQYFSNMELSISNSGDGEGGLYPPDSEFPDKGSDSFNKESKWLKDFSLTKTEISFSERLQQSIESIGERASDNSDRRGPFSSLESATAAMNSDRGSGFLGKRTENNDIYSEGTSPNISYYVGKEGIDTPDDKSFGSLIEEYSSLKEIVDLISTSLSLLIQTLITPSSILEEFKIEIPVASNFEIFLENNSTLKSELTSLSEEISYLLSIDDPTRREEINEKLEKQKETLTRLSSTYFVDYEESVLEASSVLYPSLVFWVQEIVKKPDGCLSILSGVSVLLSKTQKDLVDANDKLTQIESNRQEWFIKPTILGVFNQVILNLDNSIKRWETNILWSSSLPANKFKLKSLPFKDLQTITNEQWDFSDAEEIIELNEAGFLVTQKIISPPTQHTLFRVQSCEEMNNWVIRPSDSESSYSLQSDIVSEEILFTELEDSEGASVLEISKEEIDKVSLKVNDFLLIEEQIAQVVNISETLILLDSKYSIISLKKLFGFYYFTEL